MTDVRNPEDVVTAVIELQARLKDLEASLRVRVARRPTGDVEINLTHEAKPDTLFLQGQLVNRATYANLWQWVVDRGLSPQVFGAGNGTTTFQLPDFGSRTLRGTDPTNSLGAYFGSATIPYAAMPAHAHGTNNTGGHTHGLVTDNNGHHTRHLNYQINMPPGTGVPDIWAGPSDYGSGGHTHGATTSNNGLHVHDLTIEGSGAPHVGPSYAVNFLIWT